VNDPSQPAEPNDPRVAAAMREFHERINHGEPVDREEFIARHAEIADEMRPLIAAAAGVERISTADPRTEASAVSTGSFNRQNQETLLPDSSAKHASDSSAGGISKQFGRYWIAGGLRRCRTEKMKSAGESLASFAFKRRSIP
jgi:hypothetical protein